jgi:hypothetical protein
MCQGSRLGGWFELHDISKSEEADKVLKRKVFERLGKATAIQMKFCITGKMRN